MEGNNLFFVYMLIPRIDFYVSGVRLQVSGGKTQMAEDARQSAKRRGQSVRIL